MVTSPRANGCRIETLIVDDDGLNGSVAVRINAPVIGTHLHIFARDFHDSSDRLLVVDQHAIDGNNSAASTGIRGVKIHFWGIPTAKSGNITNVTKAGGQPIVVTTTGHWVITGDRVSIANVVGFESANGTWTATRIDANSFSLDGTENATGSYTSGGTWTTSENIDLTNPGTETAGIK